MLDRTKKGWWKDAVFYQVYPKSFQDTNADGIGDIPGIISHLDYLRDLGVDGIWLSPVYESPQKDNGYDISDYRRIDPLFGTDADFDRLVAEARDRDMIIIMDLVLNHTSNKHPWFVEAQSSRDNPYHDFYIWRDGEADTPPDDMEATFGGPAWTYVPEVGQWYYHHFSPYQPDLNWDNPKVREALEDMIRYWVDKGVGGFRLDAIEYVGKDLANGVRSSGPSLHPYLKELKTKAFPETELVSVGEAWYATIDEAKEYSNPDDSELNMIFQFGMMLLDYGESKWDIVPLSLPKLKRYYETWQHGLHESGWNSLVTSNHDLPRIVSHWGDDEKYRVESAKMIAALIHGMQGTPYIYQGEEIGMTNARMPIEDYDDLEILDFYRESEAAGADMDAVMESIYARGRDNARTPMQWNDSKYAGFSTVRPWLPVNPNYKQINARNNIDDPDSVFHFYQKLIQLRKDYRVIRDGSFTLLDSENENTFCYTRDTADEHLLVQCNFTSQEQPEVRPPLFEDARLLIGNYDRDSGPLAPYEARMLYARS